MDLQELHERTGIELRKLRYCVDHGLIPGLHFKLKADEAGRPRKFAEDVGFGIVCAAKLLELGLPHARIQGFLGGLLELDIRGKGPRKPALAAVLQRPAATAIAQLGDGLNVRLVITMDGGEYDSGWVAPGNPAKLARDYRPAVVVTLDVGQIRDAVFAAGKKFA